MTDPILYSRDGALARLTFNRPASLNAMGFEMGQRWRDLAHEITADASIGAVLIDANGPAFCAGGDVVEMATSGAGGRHVTAMADVIHDGIRTFVESDKPIVAAVQGLAVGVGTTMLFHCDLVYAAPDARFVDAGLRLGTAFQIRDDVLNLSGDAARYGKEIGGDPNQVLPD